MKSRKIEKERKKEKKNRRRRPPAPCPPPPPPAIEIDELKNDEAAGGREAPRRPITGRHRGTAGRHWPEQKKILFFYFILRVISNWKKKEEKKRPRARHEAHKQMPDAAAVAPIHSLDLPFWLKQKVRFHFGCDNNQSQIRVHIKAKT